jgi:DNA-binding transcriptional regulator YdaS (Cro superfamily)
MHLRDYLRQHNLSQAAFGQLISPPVSAGKVNHWLEGRRRVSLAEALQILRLTKGQVTLAELAEMHEAGDVAGGAPAAKRAPAAPAEASHA